MIVVDYLQSDEYIEYLKRNCGVRGYDHPDTTPTFTGAGIDIFLDYLKLMEIKNSYRVLEIGCGLGRLLKEVYDVYGCKLYGIDNNPKIPPLAKIRVGNICEELKKSNAEKIDFPDDYFDIIFCWGVFDLCEQEKSLIEIHRCLKVGGMVLLTGKSHSYHHDDVEAYTAEVAVTEKKIKHSFTNYNKMIDFCASIGLELFYERFFERRGYFMKNKYNDKKPQNFYEWLAIFRKTKNLRKNDQIMKTFSVEHSIAYNRKNNIVT